MTMAICQGARGDSLASGNPSYKEGMPEAKIELEKV